MHVSCPVLDILVFKKVPLKSFHSSRQKMLVADIVFKMHNMMWLKVAGNSFQNFSRLRV